MKLIANKKDLIGAMNEIGKRLANPDTLIYCRFCKTKTASNDGMCYFSDEHPKEK